MMKLVFLLGGVALLLAIIVAWLGISKANQNLEEAVRRADTEAASPRTAEDVSGEIIERFGPELRAKSPDHPIRRYRVAAPQCPFEEVAEVRASIFDNGDEEEIRRLLGNQIDELARAAGGDAVTGFYEFSKTRVIGGMGNPAVGETHRYRTAIVLRFTDPDCRE